MKKFLFICLLLITTNLVAQTIYTPSSQTGALTNVKPEIYQKIGKYVIIDSTGIPRTPGKDSVIIFAKGKLGIYYITWEGNVIRLDSTTAGGDSVRASFKADTVTSPYIARTNIDNNFTVQQTLPKAVTDSIMTLSNMLTIYNEAYFEIAFPDSTTTNMQGWTEDVAGRLTRTGDFTFYISGDSASNLRRWSRWQVGAYSIGVDGYQTSNNEYAMQMQMEGGYNGGSLWLGYDPDQDDDFPTLQNNELFYIYAGDAGTYARIIPELRLGGDNLVLKPSGSNKLLINNNEAIVYTDTSGLAGLGRDNTFLYNNTINGNLTADTMYGSAASGGNSILSSTSHATKGKIYLGDSILVDEATESIVLGSKTFASGVKIETVTDGGSAIMRQSAYGALSYNSPYFYFYKARGSLASPSAVVSGDIIGSFNFFGYHNGSAFSGTRADFRVMAAENFTSTANGTYFSFRTTPIGSVTIAERMRIADNGNIGIGTTPATSGALDVASTTGALIVPRMSTTQRDALTAVNGMIIYNTTTTAFNFYENGSWVTK